MAVRPTPPCPTTPMIGTDRSGVQGAIGVAPAFPRGSLAVGIVSAGRLHRRSVVRLKVEVWAMGFLPVLVRFGLVLGLVSTVVVPLAFASTPAGAAQATTTTRTAVASW